MLPSINDETISSTSSTGTALEGDSGTAMLSEDAFFVPINESSDETGREEEEEEEEEESVEEESAFAAETR